MCPFLRCVQVDMEDADMAVGEDNEPIRFEADEELSSEGDLLESSTDDWGILVEDEDEVAQEVNHESGTCLYLYFMFCALILSQLFFPNCQAKD